MRGAEARGAGTPRSHPGLRAQLFGAFKQDRRSCRGLDKATSADDATPCALRVRHFQLWAGRRVRRCRGLSKLQRHRPNTNEQTGCHRHLRARGAFAPARRHLSSGRIGVARLSRVALATDGSTARRRRRRQQDPFSEHTHPCLTCKQTMYLVARERPPGAVGVNTLTFTCRCGQFFTATTNQ